MDGIYGDYVIKIHKNTMGIRTKEGEQATIGVEVFRLLDYAFNNEIVHVQKAYPEVIGVKVGDDDSIDDILGKIGTAVQAYLPPG